MMMDSLYTSGMSEQQRAWFYAEYERARKDEVVGVLLALFLGGFGIHHFYMRRNGLGLVYLLFSWTGIPMILGWIECFFMPGRVREYNAGQTAYIASQILAGGVPVQGGGAVAPSATGWVAGPALAAGTSQMAAAGTGAEKICGACQMRVDSAAVFCPHCGAEA